MKAEQSEINNLNKKIKTLQRKRLRQRGGLVAAPSALLYNNASDVTVVNGNNGHSKSPVADKKVGGGARLHALAEQVAKLLHTSVGTSHELEKRPQSPRAAEDRLLAKKAAAAVSLKEKAMIAALCMIYTHIHAYIHTYVCIYMHTYVHR
jgi:hypothetical protein